MIDLYQITSNNINYNLKILSKENEVYEAYVCFPYFYSTHNRCAIIKEFILLTKNPIKKKWKIIKDYKFIIKRKDIYNILEAQEEGEHGSHHS